MTSSAAFRRVQAWLLEKPAAWADEDAPCLAAALMAQQPPCEMQRKRPREDALLEAERSHQRHLISQLDWELRAVWSGSARTDIAQACSGLLANCL